jgi:hypothetical protein
MRPLAIDLFCATYKTHPAEYRAWSCMRTRCTNPKFIDWDLYGGRGIRVCDQWDSFANFFEDMGSKPSPRHSLDRRDSDGNYEPDNCRWATAKEQANNWKNRNKKFSLNGETLTESEWARRIGISRESLRDRINNGWSVEKALTTPPVRHRRRFPDGTFKATCN